METEFAKRFTRVRQDCGYTQQKLAEKLGVTSQAVSKWETGASLPDIEMLKSIAIILDCSIDYLLGHDVTKESRVNLEAVERKNEIERAMQKEILELRVGIGIVEILMEETKQNFQHIHEMRLRIADRYGVLVPTIHLMDDAALPEKEYQILLYGRILLASGTVEYPMTFYCNQTAEEGTEEVPFKEPVCQIEGAWKPKKPEESELRSGTAVTAIQMILAHMEQIIIKYYASILSRQMVAEMVEAVHRKYPAVTEGVVPEKVSLGLLQKVIAGLVTRDYAVFLPFLIEFLEDAAEGAAEEKGTKSGSDPEKLVEEIIRRQKEQKL